LPRLKSSRKRLRQAQKANLRNKSVRSLLRTSIKKVRLASSKAEAEALLPQVVSVIDRTTRKGVIHRNAAARYKSQLAHKVNAMPA